MPLAPLEPPPDLSPFYADTDAPERQRASAPRRGWTAAGCLIALLWAGAGCNPARLLPRLDKDGDGAWALSDCDDYDATTTTITVYPDEDGDGYGVLEGAIAGCEGLEGYVLLAPDCAPTDPFAHSVGTWFLDNDRDGWGAGGALELCASAEGGYAAADGDCDDEDQAVNPGAEPACDGADSDCDGLGECDPPEGTLDASSADLTVAGDPETEAGFAVAGVGDVDGDGRDDVALGAPGYEDGRGAVLVLQSVPDGLTRVSNPPSRAVLLPGAAKGDRLGSAVAGGVDLDEDGTADLLVGAPFAGGGSSAPGGGPWGGGSSSSAGKVYALVGPLAGTEGDADTYGRATALDGPDGGMAGWSLACNRPGAGLEGWSCVVGAPTSKGADGEEEAGAVYLIEEPLTADGDLADAAGAAILSATEYDRFGYSVAALGDLSGDGVGDFYVGAPADTRLTDGTSSDEHPTGIGSGYLILGGITGENTLVDATWTSTIGEEDEGYGAVVAGGGDLDGDGVPDVLVGAPYGADGKGWLLVLSGGLLYPENAGLIVEAAVATVEGAAEGDQLGYGAAILPDVDGDDLAEAAVGAPGQSSERGAAGLFYGPVSGALTLEAADWSITGVYGKDRVGYRLADAGDVNGLGWPDLLIGGAYPVTCSGEWHEEASLEGNAWLFHTDAW